MDIDALIADELGLQSDLDIDALIAEELGNAPQNDDWRGIGNSALANLGRGFKRGIDKATTGLAQLGVDAFGSDEAKQFFEQRATQLNQQGQQDDSTAAAIGDVIGEVAPSFIGGAAAGRAALGAARNAPRLAGVAQSLPRMIQSGISGAAGGAATAITEARQVGETRGEKILPYAAVGGIAGAVVPEIIGGVTKAVRSPREARTAVTGAATGAAGGAVYGVRRGLEKTGSGFSSVIENIDRLSSPKTERELGKAERFLSKTFRGDDLTADYEQALKKDAEARAQGIELPLYQLFESGTLRNAAFIGYSSGTKSKVARRAIDTMKDVDTKNAIRDLVKRNSSRQDLTPFEAGQELQKISDTYIKGLQDARLEKSKPFYKVALSGKRIGKERTIQETVTDPFLGKTTLERTIYETPEILKDPIVQNAIKNVRSNPVWRTKVVEAPIQTSGLPDDDMQILQLAKERIDDQIDTAYRSGANKEAGNLLAVKKELLDVMDKSVPEYQKARNIYADDSAFIDEIKDSPIAIIAELGNDAAKAGEKVMKMEKEEIAYIRDLYKDAGADEEFQDIIVQNLSRTLNKLKDNAYSGFQTKAFGTQDVLDKYKVALSPEKYNDIKDFAKTYDEVLKALEAFGNSNTVGKDETRRRLNEGLMGKDVRGGLFNAGLDYVYEAANGRLLEDPEQMEILLKYLTTPEGKKEWLKKMKPAKTIKEKAEALNGWLATSGIGLGGAGAVGGASSTNEGEI